MAIWNEKYYKGTDVYSDGNIEDVILDIVSRDDYEENKNELIGDNFVLAYHLSSIRENILNWYPFEKTQTAIEIGAGCGAITGVLCQKLGKVVSVDLSKRRSSINYQRHKGYENLEIIVGNFNDIELPEKYDYVVLNGVFEYAISFTDSNRPYHEFLRHISKFLKPNGKFLIAIENKLGLKYFNGGKEDHTDNYFIGLNNYVGNETVRTFTKTELAQILTDEGYSYHKFYYPYPDYKFPSEIFTDESINQNGYGRPYINIETNRYSLFDECAVGESLMKENVRDIFANSFLLEASKEEFEASVIYAKLNAERKEEFQIGTSIIKESDENKVIKYAIHPSAEEHIQKIFENAKLGGQEVLPLHAVKEADYVSFKFIKEENLDAIITNAIAMQDVAEVCAIVEKFFETYLKEFVNQQVSSSYHNDIFQMYFGTKETDKAFLCVKNANIDVIMDNVYEVDGKYTLIDGEWIYSEWIPFEFIKWRAINELYSKHMTLNDLIPRNDMMEKIGVDVCDEDLFRAWAMYFAEVYVGSAKRKRWAKPITPISLDEIHREIRKQQVAVMSLYIDSGNGFSEDERLIEEVEMKDGNFRIAFKSDVLRNAKKLRFDPAEGVGCLVNVKILSENVKLTGSNACDKVEEGDVFIDLDPQYYVEVLSASDSVVITGNMRIMSKDELIKSLVDNYKQLNSMKKPVSTIICKIKRFIKK